MKENKITRNISFFHYFICKGSKGGGLCRMKTASKMSGNNILFSPIWTRLPFTLWFSFQCADSLQLAWMYLRNCLFVFSTEYIFIPARMRKMQKHVRGITTTIGTHHHAFLAIHLPMDSPFANKSCTTFHMIAIFTKNLCRTQVMHFMIFVLWT